jgi:hypothetical protein
VETLKWLAGWQISVQSITEYKVKSTSAVKKKKFTYLWWTLVLLLLFITQYFHSRRIRILKYAKIANLLQQCISGPRRSLADYVSSACGSRSAVGDTPDDGRAGVDTSDHRGAGVDTLNHPDPLRACRLPCAHRDSPGKENCARRRRNGYGVTE